MDADERLYQRVRNNDSSALEELVERYHAPLYKFLCRLTGDSMAAEDLLQETFLRVIHFQGSAPVCFRPWIYKIARNLALDYFRTAHYRYELAASPEDTSSFQDYNPAQTVSGADEIYLQRSSQEEIASALMRLRPPFREVIILRFYHGMKLEEIAEVTGTPLGTVKSRLFYSLSHLKTDLLKEEVVVHESALTH